MRGLPGTGPRPRDRVSSSVKLDDDPRRTVSSSQGTPTGRPAFSKRHGVRWFLRGVTHTGSIASLFTERPDCGPRSRGPPTLSGVLEPSDKTTRRRRPTSHPPSVSHPSSPSHPPPHFRTSLTCVGGSGDDSGIGLEHGLVRGQGVFPLRVRFGLTIRVQKGRPTGPSTKGPGPDTSQLSPHLCHPRVS